MPLPQLVDYSKLLFMYDYINDKLPLSFQETWKRKNEVYNNIRKTGDWMVIIFISLLLDTKALRISHTIVYLTFGIKIALMTFLILINHVKCLLKTLQLI